MTNRRPHWSRVLGRFLGRALAGAFVAAMLGGAALAVWVQRTLSPERLRPQIIAQLERTFQRRVDLESVGVALHQGVRVTGLKVHSRPGAPEPFFLSAELMIVRYSLPALLQRRFVLTTVRLVNPRVALYHRPDGRWNLEEMLVQARGPEGGGFSLPPLSAAEEIRLEGGTVRLVDPARGLDSTFRQVFLSVDDFSLDKPFPCRVKFSADGRFAGRSHALTLEADLELMLAAFSDDERTAVWIKRLKGAADGRRFEASGRLRNLVLPDFDAEISLPALTAAELKDLGLPAPEGAALPASAWELKVKTTPVSASTKAAGAYFVERLTGEGGPWRLEANGRVKAADGTLSGTVKTRSAPLERAAELYAPWGEHALSGTLDATVTLGGTAKAPRVSAWAADLRGFGMTFWNGKKFTDTDLTLRGGPAKGDLSVRATKGSYIAYSNALTGLDAEVRLSSGDLAVPRLALTWNGSRIALKGCVRNLKSWDRVAVDAEVDGLRVDETYKAVENLIAQRLAELGKTSDKDRPWAQTFRFAIPDRFPDMSGRLRVNDIHSPNFRAQNLDLVWGLKGIARELKTVSGHFQMGFGPGNLKNIVELQKSHPLVNALLIPYVEMHKIRQKSRASFETAIPTGLDFTRMFGDFTAVGDGQVGINFIHFDSRPFQAYAAGRADFPKDGIDLNVLLRMTEPTENLPYSMVDEAGRPAFDVSLVKDLNKPEVVFNMKKLKADAIEKGLSEGLKRVQPLPDVAEAVACRRGG